MCGIAVIVSNTEEISEGAIARMTESQQHRGPDAQTCIQLPNCHLGHTRLSIIDVSGGSQPMTEETERYWIVFNGEIYNYRELRRDLERQGWHFRTNSDTEVLLRAYQAHGEAMLTRLNGQFAFVIWDSVERQLFAARDRLGEKPLYWACSSQGACILASEIKALVASGLIGPKIDLVAVDAYLALLYVPPDRTIYENVHTLRPGHALSWKNGQLRQWCYWQPTYSQQTVSDPQEIVEKLRFLIAQAVQRQMVADVPVGAFLSGGLDSSTIVALMTQHANQPISTFSAGFGDLIDELPYARTVAQAYQTNHHELQMSVPVGEMLERMAAVYDEPFADSSNIPTYCLAEFARRHVKVALSGDGADELFGGYDWYRWLFASDETKSSIGITSLRLIALAWHVLTKLNLPFESQRNAAVYAYATANYQRRYPDVWERHLVLSTGLNTNRSQLWGDRKIPETAAALSQVYQPSPEVKSLDRATDFDVQCYLPGDILVKVDRAAMTHGLETRAPFLDVDLVEFVLSLPWQLRFQDGTLKYLLRQSCSNLWPDAVQKRSKQGFGAPVWNWIRRPDVENLLQRVCKPDSPLLSLLPGCRAALPNLAPQQVWTVLCLGLWLEERSPCLNSLE